MFGHSAKMDLAIAWGRGSIASSLKVISAALSRHQREQSVQAHISGQSRR